jgi:hypothetical protein
MSYVLIVLTVTSYGATNSHRVARFSNFHDCAAFALAWTQGQQHRDDTVQWHCEREPKP